MIYLKIIHQVLSMEVNPTERSIILGKGVFDMPSLFGSFDDAFLLIAPNPPDFVKEYFSENGFSVASVGIRVTKDTYIHFLRVLGSLFGRTGYRAIHRDSISPGIIIQWYL